MAIKRPEGRQCRRSGVFTVNLNILTYFKFEHSSNLFLVFLIADFEYVFSLVGLILKRSVSKSKYHILVKFHIKKALYFVLPF